DYLCGAPVECRSQCRWSDQFYRPDCTAYCPAFISPEYEIDLCRDGGNRGAALERSGPGRQAAACTCGDPGRHCGCAHRRTVLYLLAYDSEKSLVFSAVFLWKRLQFVQIWV